MGHTRPDQHDHYHAHIKGHDGHSHAPADFGRAFAIGVALNTVFIVIEVVYGFLAGSMALIADAGHNLSDVFSLLLAWGASSLAKRSPTGRFTYGFKSSTIMAALANAMLLLIALGMILVEAINRLSSPQPVAAGTVMVVAGIGIIINTVTALMFMRGGKHDINIRGAFLHMAADALVSLGVVISGAIILWTGAMWVDSVTSIIIVIVIGIGTWRLLRDSVRMSLLAVPDNIDEQAVRSYLGSLPGVSTVHDLHIWPLSTTETALTAHLVIPAGHPGDAFLDELAHDLFHRFDIGHATVQIETGLDGQCIHACDSC
ncbi:MAG: cation diffusion facilitator family transporter [Sphingomonadaceae bacterium]